jgi:hypothetical protein
MTGESVTYYLTSAIFIFFICIFRNRCINLMECSISMHGLFHKLCKYQLIKQGKFSPQFWYPNMNCILNVIFHFIFIYFGTYFKFKTLLTFAYSLNGLALAILPFIVMNVSGLFGFILSCFIMLLCGNINF